MKAIILSRVSSKEQADEGQSIPAQTRRLTEYINKKQLEHWKIFEITESSTHDTRKKFDEVLVLIKKSNELIALVVETVDRLQRSFKESVILDDLRKEGKVEIHFVRENLVLTKTANSSQLLQWDMAVMFARSYVLQLSDNVKRSLEQKLKNGEWIGVAPIGYINTKDEKGDSTLEPDPERAHFVAKVFELYATGVFSMRLLAAKMRAEGLRGKSGKPVSTSQIEHMLKNPFYYGEMIVAGKSYSHNYPPLTSLHHFIKCKNVREGWGKKPFEHAAKPFAFRGLIVCAKCGCTITPEVKKGKFIYYSCTNYRNNCKRLYVPEKMLLKPIKRYLRQLELPQEGIDDVISKLRTNTEIEQEFHNQAMAGLKAEYDKYENRISKMTDEKYDARITLEMYDKKLKEYKAKQSDLLSQMQEHSKADEQHHLTAAKLLDVCKRADSIFESSEPNAKRAFLNFVLQNSTLDGKKPVFTMKPVFAGIIKAHQTRNWLPLSDTFRTINWNELREDMANLSFV